MDERDEYFRNNICEICTLKEECEKNKYDSYEYPNGSVSTRCPYYRYSRLTLSK